MEEAAAHDDRRPSIFETAGGDEGMRRLAEAWHARVLADPVVSHAFSHGFRRDHTERLAAYWAEALGGPPTYSARYGDETSVVRLHSGNGEHDDDKGDRADGQDEAAPASVRSRWLTLLGDGLGRNRRRDDRSLEGH